MADNIIISQNFELLTIKSQESYPISIIEWSKIKNGILDIKDLSNFWSLVGSILLGTALPIVITILLGQIADDKIKLGYWFSFFLFFVIGILCLYFGKEQSKSQSKTKESVIDFMNYIEQRFEDRLASILFINSAKYGSGVEYKDVTILLSSLIYNNELNFEVNNENLKDDSTIDVKKTLIIIFQKNGLQQTRVYNEGENVVL